MHYSDIKVHRFRLTYFSVLSETVVAHIFPVLNENENERCNLLCDGFASKFFFGSKQHGFRSHFFISNENENERRTLNGNP
jgi:hypothetical protein